MVPVGSKTSKGINVTASTNPEFGNLKTKYDSLEGLFSDYSEYPLFFTDVELSYLDGTFLEDRVLK